jgi:hypothetical protein
MATTNDPHLTKGLERCFRQLCGGRAIGQDARTRDFCFHMTDWIQDLRALHDLFENPEAASPAQWDKVVSAFLIHASGHVTAAAKLAGFQPVEFDLPVKPRRRVSVERR